MSCSSLIFKKGLLKNKYISEERKKKENFRFAKSTHIIFLNVTSNDNDRKGYVEEQIFHFYAQTFDFLHSIAVSRVSCT